jgi:hypothetical protein
LAATCHRGCDGACQLLGHLSLSDVWFDVSKALALQIAECLGDPYHVLLSFIRQHRVRLTWQVELHSKRICAGLAMSSVGRWPVQLRGYFTLLEV